MLNRFTYSLLRFVPDSMRGEFVNIGFIVGNEELKNWRLETIRNTKRAKSIDDENILSHVMDSINDLEHKVELYLDMVDGTTEPDYVINKDWLTTLHDDFRNSLQVTMPAPLMAKGIDEAAEVLADEFLVDPPTKKRKSFTKRQCTSALYKAYQNKGLSKDQHLARDTFISTKDYNSGLDFAVYNGKALQLSQAWSFQIDDQDKVAYQIKAWAWVIRHLRENDARFIAPGNKEIFVPHDVMIYLVYKPPVEGVSQKAYDEAMKVAEECEISTHSTDEVEEVAESAKELLEPYI